MDCRPNDERAHAQGTAFMRTGNARTSVKPGRREETRSVGHVVRPRRLPPTLPPPDPPVALPVRNELSDLAADRSLPPPTAKQPRRGRGPSRPGPASLGPAHDDQPQTCLLGRTGISPATPRLLLGAACREGRVRPSPSPLSCQPSDSLVARGAAAADGPAGPVSLVEQNQATGVTTRCGLCWSAGLRQRLDDVACLCISSNSSVQGSARIAPACHRSVVLQA